MSNLDGAIFFGDYYSNTQMLLKWMSLNKDNFEVKCHVNVKHSLEQIWPFSKFIHES